MLRVLSLSALLVSTAAMAGADDLERAEEQANAAQAVTQSALDGMEITDTTGAPDEFGEAMRRSIPSSGGDFRALADELVDPATLVTIGELMDDAQSLAADLGLPETREQRLPVYVFASFSMPEASLRALIRQGELAGVPIILRGLVENSVEATMQRVHTLYEEGETQESGAVIDPTLFARFGIDQVPTVVVAAYAAGACTPQSCPTPPYVKVAGDVPLRYALERIALAKPEFRSELEAMMKTLEPRRHW